MPHTGPVLGDLKSESARDMIGASNIQAGIDLIIFQDGEIVGPNEAHFDEELHNRKFAATVLADQLRNAIANGGDAKLLLEQTANVKPPSHDTFALHTHIYAQSLVNARDMTKAAEWLESFPQSAAIFQKRSRIMNRITILFLLSLVAACAVAGQQPLIAKGGGQVPPPWFLLSWQCDPISCQENELAYSGSVTTGAIGYCVDGMVITVKARAWASNCTLPYWLTSWTSKRETAAWCNYTLLKLETLEALGATSQIFTSNNVPVGQPYSQVWTCDNEIRTGVPMVSPG